MHKFKYIPERRDNQIGCVGCGRCISMCPVNIDVRNVVNLMNTQASAVLAESDSSGNALCDALDNTSGNALGDNPVKS